MSIPVNDTRSQWSVAVRPEVLRAGVYASAPRGSAHELRLDRNEGPAEPQAAAWIAERLAAADVRQYPDASALERALAQRLGVCEGGVLVTAGGDEAIDRCARLAGAPGAEAVIPSPTFEMIPRALTLSGCAVREIAWPDEAPFPIEEMLDAIGPRTVLSAVVSPDNPTGRTVPAEAIGELVRGRAGVLTLVDLAYREFGDDDLLSVARRLPGTVCIGTFSKAYAMAGLRVGYAVADPEIIALLRACGGPFTVTAPSIAVALAMLDAPPPWIRERIDLVRQERAMLSQRLRGAGWQVTESSANFVFARRGDAGEIAEGLRADGIIVRTFASQALHGALRITCPGDGGTYDRLITALQRVGAVGSDAPAAVNASNPAQAYKETQR